MVERQEFDAMKTKTMTMLEIPVEFVAAPEVVGVHPSTLEFVFAKVESVYFVLLDHG